MFRSKRPKISFQQTSISRLPSPPLQQLTHTSFYRVKKLPLVDADNVLKGLITSKDIINHIQRPFASLDSKVGFFFHIFNPSSILKCAFTTGKTSCGCCSGSERWLHRKVPKKPIIFLFFTYFLFFESFYLKGHEP